MTELALRIAINLMGAYAVLIFALFSAAFYRGWHWRRKFNLSQKLTPEIRACLADYLAGNDDLKPLEKYLAISRSDVGQTILSFQNAVAGSARDRLCNLTLNLDLLDEWRRANQSRDIKKRRAAFAGIAFASAYPPCRRAVGDVLTNALENSDQEVRLMAAQALARYGESTEVDMVFHMATRENLLTRVLVAGPIRPHAMELARNAIPRALQSEDAGQILATLEIIVAWERALPLSGIDKLILHQDKAIRLEALRAAPLVISSPENEAAVLQSLEDADPEIAMAAAAAAGRLRIAAAPPLLAKCCRSGNAALARTAATALSALPQVGMLALMELAESDDSGAASAAAEALALDRKARGL
jgi:HEAT repeat protein